MGGLPLSSRYLPYSVLLFLIPCTSIGRFFEIAFHQVAADPQYANACFQVPFRPAAASSGFLRPDSTVFSRPSVRLTSARSLCIAVLSPLGPWGQSNKAKHRRWLVCTSAEAIRYPNKCGFLAERSGVEVKYEKSNKTGYFGYCR